VLQVTNIYCNKGAPTNEMVTFTPDTQIHNPLPARADQPKMFT